MHCESVRSKRTPEARNNCLLYTGIQQSLFIIFHPYLYKTRCFYTGMRNMLRYSLHLIFFYPSHSFLTHASRVTVSFYKEPFRAV